MSREWWDENRDKWYCNPGAIVAMVLGGLIIAALFAFLFGWLVMLLWNWLMPAIFGLPAIGYWQGWGLVLLSHILIKGGWGHGGGHGHGRYRGRKPRWCGPNGRPWEGDRGVKDDIASRVSGEAKDTEGKDS